MRLYGIQLDPRWEDKKANFEKVGKILENGKVERQSLIVLPETFATGFSLNTQKTADQEPRKTMRFLTEIALRYESWVIAGLVVKEKDKILNRLFYLSPEGELLGRYDKLHLMSVIGENKVHEAGRACEVFQCNEFSICPVICYDLRFPELFRLGTKMGANLFVVIACWPNARIDHWKPLLQARAIENQAYVVGINRTGKEPKSDYSGYSSAFDPKGRELAKLGADEDILRVRLELAEVNEWRARFPVLEHRREDLA